MTKNSIEDIWRNLTKETEARSHQFVTQAISSSSGNHILRAVEKATKNRALVLETYANQLKFSNKLPDSQVFQCQQLKPEGLDLGKGWLILTLKDSNYNDIFESVTNDLLDCLMPLSQANLPEIFIKCIHRWQAFFERCGTKGLSPTLQQALYAELWMFQQLLSFHNSSDVADSWLGPLKHKHDFELKNCSIEIKSTRSLPPRAITINNIRQTDPSWRDNGNKSIPLFLSVICLDCSQNVGQRLPELIDGIRKLLSPANIKAFEEKLIMAGYLDIHRVFYCGTCYRVDSCYIYVVQEDFPRICLSDLPEGIHEIRYELDIAAIRQFRRDFQPWLDSLSIDKDI